MDLIAIRESAAKEVANSNYTALVGRRFRFEPTPNDLSMTLEKTHAQGQLHSAKEMLSFLEQQDDDFTKDDMLATLHFYVMQINNKVVKEHGEGQMITDVSYFTDKYIAEQRSNFQRGAQ